MSSLLIVSIFLVAFIALSLQLLRLLQKERMKHQFFSFEVQDQILEFQQDLRARDRELFETNKELQVAHSLLEVVLTKKDHLDRPTARRLFTN